MRVQQTFSDDFDDLYNKYNTSEMGKRLLDIEGISRKYLDVGAMSKAYFTEHIPDATCDANANANEGISPNNYNSEIVKGISKLDGYYLLYHYAQRRYGKKRAEELINAIWRGDVYFHDATKPQIPYSYYGNTTIFARINNGAPFLVTLRDLFDEYAASAVHEGDADIIDTLLPMKIPISLYRRRVFSHGSAKSELYQRNDIIIDGYRRRMQIEVWDGERWVRLTRIIRHERRDEQKMIAIATDTGGVTVVTDDHPVVLADGSTVPAAKVMVGQKLKVCREKVPYDPSVTLDEKLAYVLGFLIGSASYISDPEEADMNIVRSPRTPSDIFNRFRMMAEALGIKISNIKTFAKTATKHFHVYGLRRKNITNEFELRHATMGRSMPSNILQWRRESMAAYLAGILDSTSNVFGDNCFRYSTRSLPIATQMVEIAKILGCVFARNTIERHKVGKKQAPPHTINILFVAEFMPDEDALKLLRKYSINAKNFSLDYDDVEPDSSEGVVTAVMEIDFNGNKNAIEDMDKYVYDVTVHDGLFYSQGLIQHNCFSYSTSLVMTEGRPYGQLHSVPPKRADSFMAQVIETTMDLSQEFAGAIAPADIIINYAWYAAREGLDDRVIINDFQKFVHVMNNKFRVSAESPFTNISLFDRYALETVTRGMVYPDMSKPDLDYIMYIQKLFGEWFAKGDPVSGMPYRFPVVTTNLTRGPGGEILDRDFLDWLCANNLNTACFNIYINEGTKIASCCRMINDVDRMRHFRGDSFGNGGANLGSHRVVTINLPRLAIRAGGEHEAFFEGLDKMLDVCRDLLQVHREEILQRRIDVGFLKFYKPLGWFNLNHMFSTIGLIGIYEAVEFMGMDIRSEEGMQFTLNMLQRIEEYARKTSRETGHAFNVEEVPGETVAVKLCEKDKVVFGADRVPYELYSNQYVPLIADATMADRMKISGKFMDMLSGGGILHLNVQERITDPAVMRHIIEYAVRCGVSHMAINYGFGTCENGHTTVCGNMKTCPVCGTSIKSWMTRVIGYFSVVSNWNKIRREYEFPRRRFGGVNI
ncbi:MAG TPA: anaerobic ribonucleoside-triphosphate reductase [Methanothrix sp.]|nr:anaerobic ribonucleoside-triphosphate reductase [Methanothrix sp.]HOL44086.1 anaerobic ribonucleoside-triphosphate reductase [Methanothrix sp.]